MAEGKEDGVQVAFQDETIWATQKAMAELFDVSVPAISQHLKNIYESAELQHDRTIKKILTVQTEGSRQVNEKYRCTILTPSSVSDIVSVPFELHSSVNGPHRF